MDLLFATETKEIRFPLGLTITLGGVIALVILLAISSVASAGGGSFGGGDGTATAPYLIEDVLDLQNISADPGANYSIVNDIDATATAGWNLGLGFTPMGSPGAPFTGALVGNGFTITGLFINRTGTQNIGLFAAIAAPAQLSDIHLASVDITGWKYVGGFSGRNVGGTITGSSASGNLSGELNLGGFVGWSTGLISHSTTAVAVIGTSTSVGGLIGYSNGDVTNCTSSSDVSGAQFVGGLLGFLNGATVANSSATGAVTATAGYSGGLIGYAFTGGIDDSSASGSIDGQGDAVGGLLGKAESSSISRSTASGDADGGRRIGGLVGASVSSTITTSSSSGDATGTEFVGGLIGDNNLGSLTTSWASGNATGTEGVGGLVGLNGGTISRSYSRGDASGVNASGGFVGLNPGYVDDGYSLGPANAVDMAGGFVGNNTGGVNNSYSAGGVTGTGNLGGFAGVSTGAIDNAFWDRLLSGQASSAGGTAKLTFELYQEATFSGFDFTTVWGIAEDQTYPYLVAHHTVVAFSIPTSDVLTGTEDVTYTIAYDIDAVLYTNFPTTETPVWTLVSNCGAWLTIARTSGTLSGTPDDSATGTCSVTVKATASDGATAQSPFSLTIVNVPDLPMITTADVLTTPEGGVYSVDYDATDDDLPGDTLTWHLTSDATWLSIDSGTGVLSGTPGAGDIGDHLVEVSVDDGNGGYDYANFSLSITDVNYPPEISTTSPSSVAFEDLLYLIDLDATDADSADVLTWSLVTDLAVLSIDPSSGVLEGTPTSADIGVHSVNVSVSDGNGGSDYQDWSVEVMNTNDAPVITTSPNTTASPDTPYSVPFAADDEDPTADVMTWSLSTNASFLTIGPTTGELAGTPSANQSGSYWVNVTVDDGNSATDSLNYTLTVNRAPETNIGNGTIANGSAGNATVGNGTAGNGTAGNGTAENGTAGNDTAGGDLGGNVTTTNGTTLANGTGLSNDTSTVNDTAVGNDTATDDTTVGNDTATGNTTVGNDTLGGAVITGGNETGDATNATDTDDDKTGGATADDGLPPWVLTLMILGLLLIAGIVTFLVMKGRSGKPPSGEDETADPEIEEED